MADNGTRHAPTRAALLTLEQEQHLVREGYDFLDEKRLLLAAEMLRLLPEYEQLTERFRQEHAAASEAFARAVARHGLQGVTVYPAETLDQAYIDYQRRSFLGVVQQDTPLRGIEQRIPHRPSPRPSPEAREARTQFEALLGLAATLAGLSGNLYRLLDEYRRTERRARALEYVLLPEIAQAITEIETRLEEIDLEEAVRVRVPHTGQP